MPMMSEVWTWLLAGLAGMAIGAFFFGSLWWTVRQTLSSHRTVLWHLGGLLLRMAVALLGFYAVGAGQWQRLVACLAGFVIARLMVMRASRTWGPTPGTNVQETPHAPQP